MSVPTRQHGGVAMLLAAPIFSSGRGSDSVLRLFDQSMHRANVKPAHVLRCAIYSGDAGFVIGCLIHACRARRNLVRSGSTFTSAQGLVFTGMEVVLIRRRGVFRGAHGVAVGLRVSVVFAFSSRDRHGHHIADHRVPLRDSCHSIGVRMITGIAGEHHRTGANPGALTALHLAERRQPPRPGRRCGYTNCFAFNA